MFWFLFFLFFGSGLVAFFYFEKYGRVVIKDTEYGIVIQKKLGQYEKVLDSGQYWIFPNKKVVTISSMPYIVTQKRYDATMDGGLKVILRGVSIVASFNCSQLDTCNPHTKTVLINRILPNPDGFLTSLLEEHLQDELQQYSMTELISAGSLSRLKRKLRDSANEEAKQMGWVIHRIKIRGLDWPVNSFKWLEKINWHETEAHMDARGKAVRFSSYAEMLNNVPASYQNDFMEMIKIEVMGENGMQYYFMPSFMVPPRWNETSGGQDNNGRSAPPSPAPQPPSIPPHLQQ